MPSSPRRLVAPLALWLGLLATWAAPCGGQFAETEAANAPALFPLLAVTNETGRSVPLLSLNAYLAEFRYLRRTFHEIDLNGPAVETDGWTHNIAEAEWPFMALCYFGYACANVAAADREFRPRALEEMRWLIDALQTPRMSGFVAPHFGHPFGKEKIGASVFVHGHFLNVCLRYREASQDTRYDALIQRVASALTNAFLASRSGVLKSYRDMWWISDNLPALAALARYDVLFQGDTKIVRGKFLRTVTQHFLDPSTGLLATYVDAEALRVVQGPRGISTMYGLHFLRELSPEFATEQYRRARHHLIRDVFGFAAVREFPDGVAGRADIDSGELVLGFGPSASGFAIAAAAVMGDEATVQALLKASVLAGLPELRSSQLRYTAMPPVGQAVILFGKTELIKFQMRPVNARQE